MGEQQQDDRDAPDDGVRDWLGSRCEELFGKLADGLLDDGTINAAFARAFAARGKATQAQETALGFLNIPTTADVERLTTRMRSVSQRLDAIEDALSRIEVGLRGEVAPDPRVEALERQIAEVTARLERRDATTPAPEAPAKKAKKRKR
jgi:polyhydroxyalkanoate synthesis regulator phasin